MAQSTAQNKIVNLIADPYDRKARLYPALLLVAPLVIAAAVVISPKLFSMHSLVTTSAGCGGAFLLTQLARDAGKTGEKRLFEQWGGMPSVSILRHSDKRLDPVTKARYHKKLALLVKGTKCPSAEQEEANPAAADHVYASWSTYLRVNVRDTKKGRLVFQENINYGYRRNVWGLRPIGIAVSAAACLITAGRLTWLFRTTGNSTVVVAGALAFDILFLLLWIFRFSPDWVRIPADTYAERLVEAVDVMSTKAPATKK